MAHVPQWLIAKLENPVVERVVKLFRRSAASSESLRSYGRTPVGEPLPHAGVLWIIERDAPELYSRIAPTPAPPEETVRLMVSPFPICPTPDCGTELEESYQGIQCVWSCSRCLFTKRNLRSRLWESRRVQKLLDSFSKSNL
jgi:hypothetical protein